MTDALTEGMDCPGFEPGQSLLNSDSMTSDWAPAFAAVPRSLFLPDLFWAHDMASGRSRAIRRATHPEEWLAAAEADIPIVTQWDDGAHSGTEPGSVPTSSASMPSLVASMLRDLDVESGQRVLEIGTGTGWNCALLAHRLGDGNVSSIEVDPVVAGHARAALEAAGYAPEVICGDGRLGWGVGGSFDRIVATCGLREIPYEWVRQTRPGGLVLAPWGTHYSNQDAVVRLTVHRDGTASGPFLQFVEFMKMRSQRLLWPQFPADGDAVEESTTRMSLPPHGKGEPFLFCAGLRLTAITHALQTHDDGRTLWLYSRSEPAWAAATFREGDRVHRVRQCGARRLWDEFEAAYDWWMTCGEPGLDRLGLTVDSEGRHRVWLDDPGSAWAV